MPLELVTAPTEEPVTVAEAREYLRIDDKDTDEALLGRLIVAARLQAESFTGRALVTQTWDLKLGGWWRGELLVPKAPLVSVGSVKYVDADGVEQTWSASNYVVDAPSGPEAVQGRIGYADGVTVPVLYATVTPVTVRFTAGYGDGDDVPESLKFGLLMFVADMYENRQSVIVGTSASAMPQTAKSLLWPFRVYEVA